jgi:hypothetical protein
MISLEENMEIKIKAINFSNEDLEMIQILFHSLIIERAKSGWNCEKFLKNDNKNLPLISNDNLKKESWFPIPGMYGGFVYQLFERNGIPLLITESWSRVVEGSGQKHEITVDKCSLVEEGFV